MLLVTFLAVVMEGELQIEFLFVRGKLLFHLNGRLVVAFLALLDRIAFLPDILAVLNDVVTLRASHLVLFGMLLMSQSYGSLGDLRPEGGLDADGIRRLLFVGGTHHQRHGTGKHQYHKK
jgi:hypothetical protein